MVGTIVVRVDIQKTSPLGKGVCALGARESPPLEYGRSSKGKHGGKMGSNRGTAKGKAR